MIVVDTNVIVSFFADAEATELAKRAMRKDADWVAPPLWLSEMRNVLATMLRVRPLGYEHGMGMPAAAENLMEGHTDTTSSDSIMQIARDSGLTAHDSEFVALAIETGTRLITLDKRLALRFPRIATPLERFVAA